MAALFEVEEEGEAPHTKRYLKHMDAIKNAFLDHLTHTNFEAGPVEEATIQPVHPHYVQNAIILARRDATTIPAFLRDTL